MKTNAVSLILALTLAGAGAEAGAPGGSAAAAGGGNASSGANAAGGGSASGGANAAGGDDHAFGFTWFAGTLDAALVAARSQGKPVFVYWGAVWCPPCRALKAEVFPQPRFAERMRSFIPVYLDGDAAAAQQWADRLSVSSYPTMLVLDGDGHERLRLLGEADIDEVDGALAGALGQGGSLAERVARALAEPKAVGAADWTLLALTTWADPALPPPGGLGPVLARVRQLAERVPATQPEAAARLAGAALQLAAAPVPAGDRAHAEERARVAAGCARLVDAWLRDERTILAARAVAIEAAADIDVLCAPVVGSRLHARLGRALALIAGRPSLPVEARLHARVAEAALWKQTHPRAALPATARAHVAAEARTLLAGPIPPALRHTAVAAAADALDAWGDDDGARALLEAELGRSSVPWYLQGELARIAAARGDRAAALRWSAAAVASARGRATQVQWRVEELKLLLAAPDGAEPELAARLGAFYDLVYALPDGFAGRNRRRLGMVAAALGPAAARPALRALLDRQRGRCASLDAASRAACEAHFSALGAAR